MKDLPNPHSQAANERRFVFARYCDVHTHQAGRPADQMSAGEDISAAMIATNFFSAPVLEQPEFPELRRRLGFAG